MALEHLRQEWDQSTRDLGRQHHRKRHQPFCSFSLGRTTGSIDVASSCPGCVFVSVAQPCESGQVASAAPAIPPAGLVFSAVAQARRYQECGCRPHAVGQGSSATRRGRSDHSSSWVTHSPVSAEQHAPARLRVRLWWCQEKERNAFVGILSSCIFIQPHPRPHEPVQARSTSAVDDTKRASTTMGTHLRNAPL